jgi:hypothetical protein
MIEDCCIRPRNGLIAITGDKGCQVPEWSRNQLVRATSSCVLVGTQVPADGETRIVLTDEGPDLQIVEDLRQVFQGDLTTPTKEVHVFTVLRQSVAMLPLSGNRCALEIWANHDSEPTVVYILARALALGEPINDTSGQKHLTRMARLNQ